jgi:hypothetical protein
LLIFMKRIAAMFKLKNLEMTLLAAVLGLVGLALFGPFITQPAHQHGFADQRMWGGIPFAMDVLSNLSFAVWGLAGGLALFGLLRRVKLNTEHALAGLFFAGLVMTTAASSWYHLQPDDAGLGVDRLGMVIAFAGLLGMAVAGRVSHSAGAATAATMLLLGPLSVWFWLNSGNVLPWLVIQFGGMALIVWMAFIRPPHGALDVRWGVVIAVYVIAKLLEAADHQVYELTSHAISGHTLKHLVASFAALPVLNAVRSALGQTQNQGRIHVTNSDNSAAH